MTSSLTPAAADALRSATADETSIALTCGQLDRKTYVEVNKALERIAGGGKWNRKAKAHLYSRDPRGELAALIGDGDEIAMPVDQIKLMSFWRTPRAVAEAMVQMSLARRQTGDVLEPSAGDGAIADVLRELRPGIAPMCVELDEARAATLSEKGHVARCTDFTAWALTTRMRFDAVLMNPPFTVPGDATAWATHIDLAIDLLRPGGRLVAVVPSSYEHRSTAKLDSFRWRVKLLGGYYEPLAAESFRESGTDVNTGLLVVDADGAL